MKGTVLILLCALALAHAYVPTSQRNTDGKACNCNPNEAKDVCAPLGTDGIFVAHEHCNQFYQCYNGIPVPFFCPANLVYNPEAEICDWPENVDCGGRPIVEADADNEEDCDDDADENIQNSGENDDSSKQDEDTGNGGSDSGSAGGGNCDPSEAPAICAANESEGVLVAHESCNYFYKCSYGLPVAIKCPGNLLFNPNTDQCDWPENVECGDRIIPDEEDSSCSGNNGGCDNGGSDNGGTDNGGTDNGGSDNGGSDNGSVGGCNCNPGEAPAICAADESEGVLVAHENCNQFYKCSYGLPVALLCPGNLLFNPYTDQCDWPENVDCGDRVTPGPEDNNGSDNGGSDNGSSDNGSSDTGGSDNGGSDNGSSDNGGSDNGGSDNGSVGGCNCNPGEAPAICAAAESEGVLVAHENCNQFYKCSYGVPVALLCPGNLLFNPYTDQCDWPENVDCGDRVIPGPEDNNGSDNGGSDNSGSDNGGSDTGGSDNGGSDNGSSDNGGSDNGGSDNGSVGGCNCNPGEAPAICAADESEGVLVAHENCNQFYKCSYGVPVALLCPGNLLFNPYTDQCDWPENVECGDRVIPGPEDNNGSDNGSSDNGGSDNGGNDNGGGDNGGSNNGGSENGGSDNGSVGGGNCDPSEAPAICAADESEGVLVAHENCNKFYTCSNGLPVALQCPGNLLFNPSTDQCDWPENVECGDRVIPGPEDNNGSDNGGSDNGGSDNEGGDNGSSDNGGSNNGGNNNGGSDNGGSDNGGSDNGGSDNGGSDNGSVGGGNCDPSEAPAICAADESEGVLIAHENCNQFYKCSYGLPVALQCPGNLLFNPSTDQCDWPENVECGDRVIPGPEDNNGSDNGGSDNGGNDNGGSDNGSSDNGGSNNGGNDNGGSDNGGSDNGSVGGGNCDPSEAPAICAADESEGVLVAHENCNQFYTCSNGLPVVLQCPGNLLFNPSTDQCDWPENVECGDRVIPGPEDNNGSDNGGNDNGGSDNGGSDNGSSDNGGSNNGGSDNGGSDNGSVGGGNCDPSEAPAICAADESEGVLVAHENCNQFYTCSNGLPVVLQCPGNLLFNPNTDQCDWPENVECGDRVIPGPEDNNGSDNGGSDNGGSDNGGSNNGGSDNGGSDNGGSDNGGSANGGSDNGSVGGGNCDPSEAPAICAADESEGVLVAHENCNKFYTCSNGLPVALQCPGNLLFNPSTDQCDWPENVECGDRVIPGPEDNNGSDNGGSDNGGSDNGSSDNGGSNNGGNDNGGSDNGGSDNGSVGGGNCDPSEAPAICAADESEGVLVAHENCNQFYTCSNGLPVALQCPGNLLFNPSTDQCDWPENVECGDRVIPGPEDNNGSDNGGNDNGGSDNGGSDNGGSDNGSVGGGNCDPSEAPAICAADESEGVLIAHENCNQFYKCSYGLPVALQCPGNLLFNPSTDQCDWPENVECGDRVIPGPEDNNGSDNGGSDNGGSDSGGSEESESDNGGNNNGGNDNGGTDNGSHDNGGVGSCNCNPNEAPAICAADQSEGVLVANENCNYFYMCANGLPVATRCPGNLLFNPYTNQCDWPENVECGDRVIPDESDNEGSDNGGSDNGGSDNGGSDNGGSDNSGTENGGIENGSSESEGEVNDNPSQAPSICGSAGSDGVFVAHEKCNKYYMCLNGVPVAVKCSGTLLYNPLIGVCDWPRNVDCGDRVIPESEDSGNCSCNARQAPSICAADGSNGKQIAHEICNQFYVCKEGVPVARACPRSLLYDPVEEACERAQDVSCENRVLYYSLDKHLDARLQA